MNEYTDQIFGDLDKLIDGVKEENKRQLDKWGIQTHSMFEWLTYTTEELGELAKAIAEYEYRDGTWMEIRKEAIQVATLALKIAEMMDDPPKFPKR